MPSGGAKGIGGGIAKGARGVGSGIADGAKGIGGRAKGVFSKSGHEGAGDERDDERTPAEPEPPIEE